MTEHRAVDFVQYVGTDLDHVVRPHAKDVSVERGVMEFAEREAVGNDGLAAGVTVHATAGATPGTTGTGPGVMVTAADPLTLFSTAGALAAGGDASKASIFQAVQKLVLKLQAKKAPFDTIVVDRLEKTPSEN